MENFSANAKKEIIGVPFFSRRAKIAFLSAIIHTAGSLILSGGEHKELTLVLESENELVKNTVDSLIRELYGTQSQTKKQSRRIIIGGNCFDKLMLDCKIFKLNENGERELYPNIDSELLSSDSTVAYIRGAFLGCGSVSLKSGYHLEFALSNKGLAQDLINILSQYEISAHSIKRKESIVVYVKEREAVSDMLALMGASISVMSLNNTYADRMVNQLANRRINCDLANIDKTVEASRKHIEAIRFLKESGNFEGLEMRLKETAELRFLNPHLSFDELASNLKISKSGVMHRLKKIVELAQSFKEQE